METLEFHVNVIALNTQISLFLIKWHFGLSKKLLEMIK